MNRTHAVAAITAALLLTACTSKPTHAQITERCTIAVNALPAGTQSTPRPAECEKVKDADYNVIFSGKALRDAGLMSPDPTP